MQPGARVIESPRLQKDSSRGAYAHTFSSSSTMIFSRLTLGFLLVTIAAFFCAQSVEAAKGPRISHKVYFDIKHGDKDLGRGAYSVSTFLVGRRYLTHVLQSFLVSTAVYVLRHHSGRYARTLTSDTHRPSPKL